MVLKVNPDPILLQKSAPIKKFDASLKGLSDKLIEEMKRHNGAGISAIQIGIPKQIIIVHIPDLIDPRKGEYRVLVNPYIVRHSPEQMVCMEGCLSFPGVWLTVKRWTEVEVEYQDLTGETCRITAKRDVVSQCLQHEINHLDGVLFTEHEVLL